MRRKEKTEKEKQSKHHLFDFGQFRLRPIFGFWIEKKERKKEQEDKKGASNLVLAPAPDDVSQTLLVLSCKCPGS